ncbi:GHKL domain-containing protein [Gordonia pseudamarae]|uniref:histidine kinase n=1 Tax=Gordonia pseudamarae TaxID=2831662 RepID=A0ABX6IHX1_9ACTN|nr:MULTISPECIES: sensor histidine kinase [Gordonia]MBD0023514.1 sensor histidine kinase [Gordonia sp. (in: high G+C Gram-positive bacteria)]QHN26039.1 GHKL domain-containing protein [Gordonia pseudamarae]QHN34964.1 GHKL domain-containing protein [Gordonia pseudamarae]
MRRLVPRTLAGQSVAAALVVVLLLVAGASTLAAFDARRDATDSARRQVTAVASTLADMPETARALTSERPGMALQEITERVRESTGVAFITIMGTDGTRFTHTDPDRIGEKYLGNTAQALAGHVYTEKYTGTLGPSIRTVVPVVADGRIVGLVSVGITEQTLAQGWRSQLPLIIAIAVTALIAAGFGLWLVRRRLLRATGGLAPRDLRIMYEHHDAVLHAVREGLIVIQDHRIVLVNDEAIRLIGDLQPDLAVAPDFLRESGPVRDDELVAHRGRILVVNRSPVPGRAASAVVTVRDRTELSEAMGELDSMTRFAEALRSQAHESANRMHTIVAMIEMGRAGDAAQMATTELELSQQLIDTMTESVHEPALVALLLGKSAQASERGISFTLTEESQVDDAAMAVLSPRDVVTVVGNLVDNALDAADPDDPWVEVTVTADDAGVRIVVADSGPGMDLETLAAAQHRGFSTKDGGDERGRGLGLALVTQVVAAHRGQLRAENTYGSVVSVVIPADPNEAGEV